MLKPFSLQVEGIQGDIVTAISVDGQTWHLPTQAIYGTVQAGQELRLIAVAPHAEDAGKQAFAGALLNELLGNP